jgi:hypothetical protein
VSRHPAGGGDDAIARRLREVFERHAAPAVDNGAMQTMSAPAFRAIVAERLRSLEREVAEVRARINGLVFVVLGAVVTQLVLKAFA